MGELVNYVTPLSKQVETIKWMLVQLEDIEINCFSIWQTSLT